MSEKRTKDQIILDAHLQIEMACVNIFETLQESEITLISDDILRLADRFYEVLDRQNNKVIVTGDGKYA